MTGAERLGRRSVGRGNVKKCKDLRKKIKVLEKSAVNMSTKGTNQKGKETKWEWRHHKRGFYL